MSAQHRSKKLKDTTASAKEIAAALAQRGVYDVGMAIGGPVTARGGASAALVAKVSETALRAAALDRTKPFALSDSYNNPKNEKPTRASKRPKHYRVRAACSTNSFCRA